MEEEIRFSEAHRGGEKGTAASGQKASYVQNHYLKNGKDGYNGKGLDISVWKFISLTGKQEGSLESNGARSGT